MQFPVYLEERLRKFVRREAHVPGATITGLARKFLQGLKGHNRDSEQNKQSFPVDPRKLPSERNTIRRLTPLFKAQKSVMALLRHSDNGRGYAAQIARGDLNVVDIDGTVADCFLRFGDATVAINGVLKPTVLLAVDRSSRVILGWYVTYRAEDADSYLACIFNACTDKEDELARWNVSHLDGMVAGTLSKVFVDRGAGISEKVSRAMPLKITDCTRVLAVISSRLAREGEIRNTFICTVRIPSEFRYSRGSRDRAARRLPSA